MNLIASGMTLARAVNRMPPRRMILSVLVVDYFKLAPKNMATATTKVAQNFGKSEYS
ncbi:hypothetical protein K7432_004622 [Basidiobolus ranarum]|uniref:Uncharacterized protein n=1 Tax=Basidiobolus ranarum TaxID=34480 RepID=A0ABR2WXS8_9FUNG